MIRIMKNLLSVDFFVVLHSPFQLSLGSFWSKFGLVSFREKGTFFFFYKVCHWWNDMIKLSWFMYSKLFPFFMCVQEDEFDLLPMGRLARDSAIFRKAGGKGIMERQLLLGKMAWEIRRNSVNQTKKKKNFTTFLWYKKVGWILIGWLKTSYLDNTWMNKQYLKFTLSY